MLTVANWPCEFKHLTCWTHPSLNIVESWSESQTMDQMDKKGMKFFMKRVQKLDNMREVSRREHKLIRKLLRSNKSDNGFNWESILFHFPGKRLQELQDYTVQNFPRYFQNANADSSSKVIEDFRSEMSIED